MGAIDEKWLEDFKAYLVLRMKQNTANNYYAKIKAVLRKANREGYINRNPSENVKYFPAPETEKEFLSTDEIKKLAETPCKNPDIKRAFLFACFTGPRFSDVKASLGVI